MLLLKDGKIRHDLIRPDPKDYANGSEHFQAVCKYLVLKFKDTYEK